MQQTIGRQRLLDEVELRLRESGFPRAIYPGRQQYALADRVTPASAAGSPSDFVSSVLSVVFSVPVSAWLGSAKPHCLVAVVIF
jgi:hypothetical protein